MEPQQHMHDPVVPSEKPSAINKKPIISTPAAILTGAALIALSIIFVFAPKKGTTAPNAERPSMPTSVPAEVATLREDDYVRGARTADVLIIEYSDSDCPFCSRFHPTMEQIVEESKGTVAWVYRHFPLTTLHPNAYTEALALECVGEIAGNDAFQNYLDTIVNVTLNPDPKSNQALFGYAKDEGVSEAAFTACINGENATKRIDASINEAQSIGAQGTPFSIAVNQKTGKQVLIPGAYPIEEVRAIIDSIK